ncbi:acetyl-CoA carboxylase biotin carboxyl carrier protein subunit [Lacinutrix sp. C3R15]|uniref:acetyl-CoA carboxylase biotin carboxyl carrier protein subunit n=1 Tax=Flavobacteriaceae TaxID=49546 RepID=UPI001C093188|nr:MULTISPECIES: acetyl-CoA carboxylase biotin carboxyl carrier protein subunit [Flavobacteriaceae]MBU2940365.1 acetyl-CoA carboxylase biotin carboxyl carrier protein subunit [Lacinutrix sp. C3R15]MDO6623685.1 acetyl-CoA carboxylase biotin carboxyl carrier protein subunit [Oceanihabitans sp. 1_MG-2023]
MNTSYTVKINNTTEIDITKNDALALDAIEISSSKFHILQENNSYKAEITEANFNEKTYKVKVNNNTYNININNDLDLLIKEMGFEVGATKKVNDIKAPMPGLILEINVQVGQEVQEDDSLLILEAMKMENVLTSPRDGIIKSISITKGEAVEKNQLLIEFE